MTAYHLFTYGTLMFEPVFRNVAGHTFERAPARLSGYRRLAVRGEAYPGIIEAASSESVDGIVYFGMDFQTMERLDRFEGPRYGRETVTATMASGDRIHCQTYVFSQDHRYLLINRPWLPEEFLRYHLTDYLEHS